MSLEMENTMVEIILWIAFAVCAYKVSKVEPEKRMGWTISALALLVIVVLFHTL